jgi:peptide maturation system protein (TIGR04066 family)
MNYMSNNGNLLICTSDITNFYTLEYFKTLSGYNDVSFIILGIPTDGNKSGMYSMTEYDSILNQFDTVLFTDFEKNAASMSSAENSIFKAIKAGKNVICSLPFKQKTIDEMKITSREMNKTFIYNLEAYEKAEKDTNTKIELLEMKEIKTPVVFVIGVAEKTQKFYIQLALRQHFSNKGYKIAQIGTKSYCELLGFHSFPLFMDSPYLSELSKIILFNHYVKKIEKTEKPDVIIIGIPGGIIPLDNKYNNKFGITAFEVSQAVCPDAVILSTLFENFPLEYFIELNLISKYRLGFEIDCFNISNVKFDWAESMIAHKPCYLSIDPLYLNKRKSEYNIPDKPVFNVMDNADCVQLADYILDKLSEYAQIEII